MRRNPLRSAACALALTGLLGGSLAAQGTVTTILGDSTYDALGSALGSIGDVNGDGRPDIVIGAYLDDNNGQDCGLLRVYDGVTGTALYSHDGDSGSDEFGWSANGVGDVNGDGTPDYAGGAHFDDNGNNGSGMVRVYSGANATLLWEFNGDGPTDAMGSAVAPAGDVNNDGFDDILVGAEEHINSVNSGNGYARVYSGATGATLFTVTGGATNDRFGYSVDGGKDLNGDGNPDIVVGAYGEDTNGANAGAIYAYDHQGNLLWDAFGDNARDHLGNAVSVVDDLNGDGMADVIAGALENDNTANNAGMIRVYSGADGSTLGTVYGLNANDQLGSSVSGATDMTGDGVPDLLAGAWNYDGILGLDTGAIFVINGATFAIDQQAEGAGADDRIGHSCAGLGDVNGDGQDDYVGGGRQYGGIGPHGPGVARVYDPLGTPPPPPIKWPNLPTTFMSVGSGYNDDFESYGGVVPSHFGINELEFFTRSPDIDAYCNIGQHGMISGQAANSGIYALEMGGTPLGMTTNHDVSNGLVIGLNAAGLSTLELDMWVYNHGEEQSADDGVWLSEDGLNWEKAYNNSGTSWSTLPAAWSQLTGIDLMSTNVNTNGDFYLLLAQQDNFEFANQDGLAVDDISVHAAGAGGPTLAVTNLVAGQTATISITNGSAGGFSGVAYSITGPGPATANAGACGAVTVSLSPPFTVLPLMVNNASGTGSQTVNVPPPTSGLPVWFHGLDVQSCTLTNPIATTVG